MLQKIFVVLGISLFAGPLLAVELENATNAQLLLELEYRLGGAGGGGNSGSASVSYSCDSYGYLYIEAFSADGELSSTNRDLGNASTHCAPHLDDLNRYKARVTEVTQIGLCDSYGYLHRYGIRTEGTITSLGSRDLGAWSDCWPAAQAINSRP